MQLLQQRTLLGWIEGAEDNVDLGALLTRLSAVSKDDLKTKLTAALAAYQSSVVAFQRDNILPDVSAQPKQKPQAVTVHLFMQTLFSRPCNTPKGPRLATPAVSFHLGYNALSAILYCGPQPNQHGA